MQITMGRRKSRDMMEWKTARVFRNLGCVSLPPSEPVGRFLNTSDAAKEQGKEGKER